MREYLWLLCLLVAPVCTAQTPSVLHHQAVHFQIKKAADNIDFIVIDTVLTQKKPVFLFCQGSLPLPLFVSDPKYGTFLIGGGVSNFDVKAIREHYHLVVISMPETPVTVPTSNLNDNYCYVPDSTQKTMLDMAFFKADYLENYVQRAQAVLRFLSRQSWVDASRLVVAGHSQGSKVAAKIARANKKVTHLGLFGANPSGRVDQFVREARKKAERGDISWEEADQLMEQHYQNYKAILQPDAEKTDPTALATRTFSEPMLDDWLALHIPIYLAYGTHDIVADQCDLAPIAFLQQGKNNLTVKRYLRMEHNFFEIGADGRAQYDKAHWAAVMQAFVDWTLR
jgi:dienelactone hydrolase